MKVLVLTCSTGGGHNACAKHIKDEFLANNIECIVQDYMDIIGPKASRIAEKIYLDSTKNNGLIFKGVYRLGEIYSKTNIPSPVYGLNSLVKEKLANYIKNNNIDIVIGTHLFPCIALTALNKDENVKFINVATDYECIPFWEETQPLAFVIPHESLKKRFIEKKVPEDILLPLGIPVSSKFSNIKAKKEKQILLTSGSMGFGKIKNIVLDILKEINDYKLVVVCGHNEKLKLDLLTINNPNLEVLGFVNNMNELILKSSIVVTKPGGLTTTEVAILNRPIVFLMPIPGVENYNANFFVEHKMALKADDEEEVITKLKMLISDEKLQEEFMANQRKFINKYSARDLVSYVLKIFSEKSD